MLSDLVLMRMPILFLLFGQGFKELIRKISYIHINIMQTHFLRHNVLNANQSGGWQIGVVDDALMQVVVEVSTEMVRLDLS